MNAMGQEWLVSMKDRITAMFLGIAIGDALGMPVETMTGAEIASRFGRVTRYLSPDGHKWYDGCLAGRWTDDTQLTLAIAESLIAQGEIDLDDLARRHIQAMDKTTLGWGGSTKRSVARLKAGVPWSVSGEANGAGNGVAMKAAPFGALLFTDMVAFRLKFSGPPFEIHMSLRHATVYEKVASLALMTHKTRMGVASGLVQTEAILACLIAGEEDPAELLLKGIAGAAILGERYPLEAGAEKDSLSRRLIKIRQGKLHKQLDVGQLAKSFDWATCYAYNSLPFSYAAFLRNPRSIETLYDVASAGGDTDTNASIVGGMLGALNGTRIFPDHLVQGLWKKDEVIGTAKRFCEKFLSNL